MFKRFWKMIDTSFTRFSPIINKLLINCGLYKAQNDLLSFCPVKLVCPQRFILVENYQSQYAPSYSTGRSEMSNLLQKLFVNQQLMNMHVGSSYPYNIELLWCGNFSSINSYLSSPLVPSCHDTKLFHALEALSFNGVLMSNAALIISKVQILWSVMRPCQIMFYNLSCSINHALTQ